MSKSDSNNKVTTYYYDSVVIPFVEERGDIKINKKFRKKAVTEKVIQNDAVTVVILDDKYKSKGVVRLYHKDTFNTTKGVQLAYLKAKINSLTKEFNELCGEEKIQILERKNHVGTTC